MFFSDDHGWFGLLLVGCSFNDATDVAGALSGGCERRIWNGVLATIPRMSDEKR
jgi:hypothetical protein